MMAAVMVAALSFVACDTEPSAPVIKLEQNPFEVAANHGEYAVEYVIQNPVVGGRLDVDTDCDWIEELDANYEKVKFTDEALKTVLGVPRVFLPLVLKGCVDWAKENNVELITEEHMKIINDKRSKEKNKK